MFPASFRFDPIIFPDFLAPVAQILLSELVSKAAQRKIVLISAPDIKYHPHSERLIQIQGIPMTIDQHQPFRPSNPSHSTQITSPCWCYFYGRSPVSHREFPLEMVQHPLCQVPATSPCYSSKTTIRGGSFLKSRLDLDLTLSTSQIQAWFRSQQRLSDLF